MQKRSSGGCGSFLFLLFVVFLVLKLTGAVDWSWWWVLSPLWLPAALGLALLVVLSVTGVSIYKIVSRLLRGQRGQRGAQPGGTKTETLEGDVVEAGGSEIPTSAGEGRQTRALPAAGVTPEDAGGSAGGQAGGGPAGGRGGGGDG
jgi:hypothetical protein